MQNKLLAIAFLFVAGAEPIAACCAVTYGGKNVVNADQSVIILWDKAAGVQHFIRRASFKTDAADLGFIVPSPSRPSLEESGDAAFATLERITAPPPQGQGLALGCAAPSGIASLQKSSVTVVETKRVAGYDATVLTARDGKDLTNWLKAHGYPYSEATADWAAPYLGGSWHFTVLKLSAKPRENGSLKASALRISFKTKQALFPYREPMSGEMAEKLDAGARLLRIFFLSDTQYQGRLGHRHSWSGKTVWSGDVTAHRGSLLSQLDLPKSTLPGDWWLTAFEDRWAYRAASGDLYFSPTRKTAKVSKGLSYRMDVTVLLLLAGASLMSLRKEVLTWMGKELPSR